MSATTPDGRAGGVSPATSDDHQRGREHPETVEHLPIVNWDPVPVPAWDAVPVLDWAVEGEAGVGMAAACHRWLGQRRHQRLLHARPGLCQRSKRRP